MDVRAAERNGRAFGDGFRPISGSEEAQSSKARIISVLDHLDVLCRSH